MSSINSGGSRLLEKFPDTCESCVGVPPGSGEARFKRRHIGVEKELVAAEKVPKFKAVINGLQQVGARVTQLSNASALVHNALGNRHVGHRQPVGSLLLGVQECEGAVNSGAELFCPLEQQGGSTGSPNFGFRSAEAAGLPVLPPRHKDGRENAHDRENRLNPRGLSLRFKRAPANPFAVHSVSPVCWREA